MIRRSASAPRASLNRRATSIERTPAPGIETDIFQWLSPEVREAVATAAVRRHVDAGGFIFQHGDSERAMYRVLEGTVRLSLMRIDGHQMIYGLLGPGECLAASSLIFDHPLPQTAEALDDVQLQVVGPAAFNELRTKHREFDNALLQLFARRLRTLSNQVATAKLGDLPSQIVLRLLELARRDPQGRLMVTVTHSELATFVSVSRQSIHRVVKSLAAEGLIALHYGSIELLHLDRLKAKAEFL
ncbi:Crp/Fnr family transcriptional regulator [Rhodopseudomonas sp. AAP120]|uniref:Crp/Fnr family transcriptional regulator n=1 Tax=Rhodopseudomonas sp. AAP120 TaxID=1523430 RepID=UPI0006B8BEAB|nr:Crp/Fnr family transcriptional regulator [Rhodopseudomonas sp. AAP120]